MARGTPMLLGRRAATDPRNALRLASGLPLLDTAAELLRLQAVADEAQFEAAFTASRDQYAHQWTSNRDGYFANLGRYAAARKQVRDRLNSK